MRCEAVNALVADTCPPNSYPEQWDIAGLKERLQATLGLDLPIDEWLQEKAVDPEMLTERIEAEAEANMVEKAGQVPAESWIQIEKSVLLQSHDPPWKAHPIGRAWGRETVGQYG